MFSSNLQRNRPQRWFGSVLPLLFCLRLTFSWFLEEAELVPSLGNFFLLFPQPGVASLLALAQMVLSCDSSVSFEVISSERLLVATQSRVDLQSLSNMLPCIVSSWAYFSICLVSVSVSWLPESKSTHLVCLAHPFPQGPVLQLIILNQWVNG